jgi:NAD+ synthase (glutamine-hydrolysing)
MAIARAYRGMDDILGFAPQYVFGLSGGIDSSVACAVAVETLGKERVVGYNFPGPFNSEATKSAASELAENLGIACHTISIEGIQNAVLQSLGTVHSSIPGIVAENVQAKIRYTDLLSNLAQIHGGVMTCNGNNLEIEMGYCTLYGDVGGLFAPLGDLTKEQVYNVARLFSEIPKKLIPDELLNFGDEQIYPTAELAGGQRDPMKFGYHCRLLQAVMGYRRLTLEDAIGKYESGVLFDEIHIPKEWVKKYNLLDKQVFLEDLRWFFKRLSGSVFKRVQAPPILITSRSAFGYDYRESIL